MHLVCEECEECVCVRERGLNRHLGARASAVSMLLIERRIEDKEKRGRCVCWKTSREEGMV
jgi:hypothetical protein